MGHLKRKSEGCSVPQRNPGMSRRFQMLPFVLFCWNTKMNGFSGSTRIEDMSGGSRYDQGTKDF